MVIFRRYAVVVIPIGAEETFMGVVDVIEGRAIYFRGENGEHVCLTPTLTFEDIEECKQ